MRPDKSVVLDASVIIALLNKEHTSKNINDLLPSAVISSVTYAEIINFYTQRYNLEIDKIRDTIGSLISNIIAFDHIQAEISGSISLQAKTYGLSLGDRACIALGMHLGAPIFTADKIWAELKLPNAEIILIR